MIDLEHLLNDVHGFLTLSEAQLLYNLASEAKADVVEIGSYQGRSTIALALGAKAAGVKVYAIDHHPDYTVGNTHFSAADNQIYLQNIARWEVGHIVYTINLPSHLVVLPYPIDFVWIDGSHEFEDVSADFLRWSHLTNKIVMHDSSGNFPAIDRVIETALENGWHRVAMVDAISVLVRLW